MVNTSIGVLHGEHPVQVVADFFQQFRVLRELSRNIPGKRIHVLREVLVYFEQSKHGYAGVYDVLAVVTRIVPAAVRLDYLGLRVLRHILQPSRLGKSLGRFAVGSIHDNAIVHVARGTLPLARILLLERHARTLVVEPL